MSNRAAHRRVRFTSPFSCLSRRAWRRRLHASGRSTMVAVAHQGERNADMAALLRRRALGVKPRSLEFLKASWLYKSKEGRGEPTTVALAESRSGGAAGGGSGLPPVSRQPPFFSSMTGTRGSIRIRIDSAPAGNSRSRSRPPPDMRYAANSAACQSSGSAHSRSLPCRLYR